VIGERVRREMHQHFRPEFLNRIDDIILFRPLEREDLRRIVDLQLDRVRALAVDLGVTLEVSDKVKDLLAREGYDPVFGARPLKRVIQQRIQNPLALRLLEEEVEEGTRVTVLPPPVEGGDVEFRFGTASPQGAQAGSA
jgi:ATP-dependent Clp protease ATP-binding subunit ClpB